MKARLRSTLILLLLGLLVALVWIIFNRHRDEPVYAGKPLSHWLRAFEPIWPGPSPVSARDASRAIRHVGTNGIPLYLEMLQAVDSPLKTRLQVLVQKQKFLQVRFTTASALRSEAHSAFSVLGVRARSAVPALMELCRETPSIDSKLTIIQVLGNLGPEAREAVPLLESITAATNAALRSTATNALENIRREDSGEVGSWIRKSISDDVQSADTLRQANALRQVYSGHLFGGGMSGTWIPMLVNLLHQPRTNSYWLRFALESLDPDLAANVVPVSTEFAGFPPLNPPDPTTNAVASLTCADAGRLIAVGDWSEPASDLPHRLRGRLMIYEVAHTNREAGLCQSAVFVELQDVTAGLNQTPLTLFFDARESFDPVLNDSQADLAPVNSPEPQDLSKPRWIIVPINGAVRFPVGVIRVAHAAEIGGRTIQLGARTWAAAANTLEYSLSAEFKPPKDVRSPLDYNTWGGTLQLLPVKLPREGP